MMIRWIKGMLIQRPGSLFGAMAGVAVTITLLAFLEIFLVTSAATMTARAISGVPIDWQVLLAAGTDAGAFQNTLEKAVPCRKVEKVGYASVDGFSAATGGSVQTTGPGKVLGISANYRTAFPGEIRQLTGSRQGVLVAQQTAANLHVKEGDSVTITRVGLPPVQAVVDGIVDLPYADSLFQAIGVPPGTAPQAPPDNVLLIPIDEWHGLFDSQARLRPDTVSMQFHVTLSHALPSDPAGAYTQVTRLANNLEARSAGSATVGNNLGARLDAVRSDASYARVLFLFLGLPGALLGILFTLAIIASGKKHRAREQALLRLRGASIRQVLAFQAVEALMVGTGGVLVGAALTFGAAGLLIPNVDLLGGSALLWLSGSSAAGLVLAACSVLLPAWKQARQFTVSSSKGLVRSSGKPLWKRLYVDVVLLVISSLVYWRIASSGYQVVLASEGVAQISVHYEAFIAPFCLWLGGVLLGIRLLGGMMRGERRLLSTLLNPMAGNLSRPCAASAGRQGSLLSRGVLLVALAVSFAVSTAVFNTTYTAQSRVDAELTNGADVTISGSTAAPAGSKLADLKTLPGVAAAQPMMHRFAYVGHDLQDIYGIDPRHIGEATHMSDAFFAGGSAKSALSLLAAHPDGVLVSEETRQDFQLRQGDQLNLRLQSSSDHQYHVVPFRFLGVVREFPTAPTDSFLVANASYIAEKTGSGAEELVLLRAQGDPGKLSLQVKRIMASLPGGRVTDIESTQKVISSGLTSMDLRGLTRLELFFAVLLVMGATGLILALGLNERRRNFAILFALGAKSGQLGAFIWSEVLLVVAGGGLVGAFLGMGLAQVLVKVLQGVFDPPPEHLVLPWIYLMGLALAAVFSTALAVLGMKQVCRRPTVEELRKL